MKKSQVKANSKMGTRQGNFTLKSLKKSILAFWKMVSIKAREGLPLKIMYIRVFSTRARRMVMVNNFILKQA